MIAVPVTTQESRGILEASREEARAIRLAFRLEPTEEELQARRRRLCQKPEPKFKVGFEFDAHLTAQGKQVEMRCRITGIEWEFSRHWGQTPRFIVQSGKQTGYVLTEQIERAMNPALAKPRYTDYCEDCE